MGVWGKLSAMAGAAAVALVIGGCAGPVAPASTSTPASTPASAPAPSTPAASPSVTPSATPTPTPSPTPSEEPVTRIEVRLTDGKAEPNGDKVELGKGDTVEFVVTADHDDELHIHGMDIEIPVEAGKTVTRAVVVESTGRFEVESHHPALVIVQLIVR